MSIFRLVMMALAGGLGSVAAVLFALYVVGGNDRRVGQAKAFGRWAWAATLLWFNVEVWGRVIWTVISFPW